MNATAEEITKQIIFGSVIVAVAALPFVGMLFGAIALRKCKGICRTESHDSVLILHMKKGYIFRALWNIRIFRSITAYERIAVVKHIFACSRSSEPIASE